MLVHEGDAMGAKGGDADRQRDGPTVDFDDGRSVRGVEAAEDLDERRLAGAVLAQQAVNLAMKNGEAHVVERPRAAKALGKPRDAKNRRLFA